MNNSEQDLGSDKVYLKNVEQWRVEKGEYRMRERRRKKRRRRRRRREGGKKKRKRRSFGREPEKVQEVLECHLLTWC